MRRIRSQNIREKALIAFVVAGGAGAVQPLAAICEEYHEQVATTLSVAQQIADSKEVVPFTKAYLLLDLSASYLSYSNRKTAEQRVAGVSSGLFTPLKNWTPGEAGRGNVIAWFSSGVALEQSGVSSGAKTQDAQQLLADETLKQAVAQIELIPEPARRLKLYSIASMLFKKANDSVNSKLCKKIVDEKLEDCANHLCSDEKQIAAAVFVLNSEALSLLPYAVGELGGRFIHGRIGEPDGYVKKEPNFIGPVAPQSFREAEALRLKAVAIADQLDAKSDVRRRAHRDMAIWYQGLGKAESAEKEKETLFALVGFRDDRVLYPQSGTCGVEIWWLQKITQMIEAYCGMG